MLHQVISQNTLQQWLISAGMLAVLFAGMLMARKLIIRHLQAVAKRTRNVWDDLTVELIEKTSLIFMLVVAVYVSSVTLVLPQVTTMIVEKVLILALLLQVAIWGSHLLRFWSSQYKEDQIQVSSVAIKTLLRMGFILRVLLWTLLVLLALDNLGVDITTLVAGLGITGVAVALAVQNILKDLFSALSIVLDKPFEVGDFIIVDTYLGSIERIGLKTTRIRSLTGELLVFSNSDLLQSRIRNYKHMYERRVVFALKITYDTPLEKVAAIPEMIKEIIVNKDLVRFDRAHFAAYGDFALEYEVVYWLKDPDYTLYMDTQQAINLEIFHRFQREGIRFAFPTQTLQVQMLPTEPSSDPAPQSDDQTSFLPVKRSIHIESKCVSEPATPADGTRVLVDGYWPPGITKEDAAIDLWLKEIAPSAKLRRWFGGDPEKWADFQRYYAAELEKNPEVVQQLLDLVHQGKVTLIFSGHNTKINAAAALAYYLRKHCINNE